MTGALAVTPEFLIGHGSGGSTLRFLRALSTPRSVWVSSEAHAEHSDIANMIMRATQLPHSRWKVTPSEEAFLRATLKQVRGKYYVVGVVSLLQALEPVWEGVANVFSAPEFLKFITHVDTTHSAMGVCGM